ncbi:hypothetical protein BRADI_5g10902v3, partial [Brachypodium distachyon]
MSFSRDQGGLGVTDLDIKNISLLCKWLWKLENEDGKRGQSHFWQGLMQVKNIFINCCRKQVGNGDRTCFWEEHWIGDAPLCSKFPRLYNLTNKQFISVSAVFKSQWQCISFRRSFCEETLEMRTQLRMLCLGVCLNEEHDRCIWKLTNSGQFSIKSLYNMLKDKQ